MSDDDREKYPSEIAERFQVRLPPGLRSRIKAYAEQHGRSMNAEIVRVLEAEFPEPWPKDRIFSELLDMVSVLQAGASDEHLGALVSGILDAVQGIASGRVKDVDDATRKAVAERLQDFYQRRSEEYHDRLLESRDEEEIDAYYRSGETAKF